MKFAKELERDLVPEWRAKYLDYKVGKKKLKAINRAIRTVHQTPRIRRRGTTTFTPSPYDTAPKYSFLNRNTGRDPASSRDPDNLRGLKQTRSREEEPLNAEQDPRNRGLTRYGSILGTPPQESNLSQRSKAPPSLKLPTAALDPENASPDIGASNGTNQKRKAIAFPPDADNGTVTDNAFEVGKTRSPPASKSLPSRYKSIFSPKRMNSMPGGQVAQRPKPLLKRVFSLSHGEPPQSPGDVPMEAYRELDLRQTEFFNFLDMELDKIESFYKQKEDEATERLSVLREQLHVMRDKRLDELITRQTAKIKAKAKKHGSAGKPLMNGDQSETEDDAPNGTTSGHQNTSWLNPVDAALKAVQAGKYGKSTKAMQDLATPGMGPQHPEDRRDYSRRPEQPDIPYQTARRKLKIAMQEYYRGLELLKSYALLNRTGFRKINKKYDKTVNARPSLRYMTEKVNQASFVNSDVIEGHIRTTEDLYARYFEKGKHKVAVGKLRVKIARAGDYTENSFRNGLMLGLGAVFAVQGIVKGTHLLSSDDIGLATNTSYMLQIYAGYFFVNLLFMLFCLDCRVWHESKINYVFVFEYDTRHHLDWRQLSELPCFFFFLLGFFMWITFSQFGAESLFVYYPVILVGVTVLIMFNPLPYMYFRSRMWLIYSLWRLVGAGMYPVEWRDFYMGDMFCSLTYSMGNIELFFCLYVNEWSGHAKCNSSSSRLLGFFTALPSIWRAIQCFRRYYDTGNAFPHLLNLGKYMAGIVFYMTLSIYRINKSSTNHAAFITFAIVNSIYTSFWDVYYDWSLGDPNAKYKFLRQTLGYKKVWMYYLAIIVDPLIRFNWICYAIAPLHIQHSAMTSFFVSLSEVFRRGLWSLFRVENEHCSNVGHFRASRDVPLPYDILASPDLTLPPGGPKLDEEAVHPQFRRSSTVPNLDLGLATTTTNGTQRTASTRRRRPASSSEQEARPSPLARGLTRIGTVMRNAHAQDFEKKKKPELGAGPVKDEDSDDDDDEENTASASESATPRGDGGGDTEDEAEMLAAREDVEVGRAGASSSAV